MIRIRRKPLYHPSGVGTGESLNEVPEAFTDPRFWAPFSLVGEGGSEASGAEAGLQQ